MGRVIGVAAAVGEPEELAWYLGRLDEIRKRMEVL